MKLISLYNRLYCVAALLGIVVAARSQSTGEFTVDGLKVILHQTQKETLVMSMYFKGGSTNYSAANAGIESLALAAITECGTTKFPASDFNDQVDEYGLHLNSQANNDYSVVKLGCISMYTNEAWQLFAAALASPAFETQKFSLLKEQKINELKLKLSNPDERLERLAQEFAFATTPYSINPEGSVTNLSAFTRDAVKDYYYTTLLNKNRMFLVVAGKISKEDLEKKVREAFSAVPVKTYTASTIQSPVFTKETSKIEGYRIATNYVSGILNAPVYSSPDYPAFRLGVSILNSAMFEVIRLSKNLSYAPSASLSEGQIPFVTMYASTSQPQETVEIMRSLLAYMKSNTYSERIIESVRKHLLLAYMSNQEKMTDIADELGKAEILGDWKLAGTLDTRLSSVTASDVKTAFNTYAKNITWVYIGDPQAGEQSFK